MTRKLAHIEEIGWIKPIDGKDRIVLAGVLGWQVIVQKDMFSVGDKVIFCEIDSVFPEKPEYEFLRNKKFRIKSMKMGGVLSEGLCLPLSQLPESNYQIGDDVTELLGITQYEPDMDIEKNTIDPKAATTSKYPKFLMRWKWFRDLVLPKKEARGFPSFVKRTDEERIQNRIENLNMNIPWIATEKIDGCLVGETLIKTDQGDIRIREIVNHKMQVNVLTYNEDTKQCEYKPIIDWHKIPATRDRYKIGVGHKGKGNRPKFIECTDNHMFLTQRGWVRADELTINDTLKHYSAAYPNEIDEIILGCLLGDSSLNANSDTGDYRTVMFDHSIKQQEYFEYKAKIFGSWFIRSKNRISGYGSEMVRGQLVANLKTWNLLNELFPNNGKKIITKEYVDKLTPISLAFWYMDDGSICNREDDNLGCRIHINTQGFSLEEHKILQEALKRKFNIESTIGDKDVYKGYVLILDVENTKKFCSLIAPYICKSMKYKLPKEYEDMPCVFEHFNLDYFDSVVDTKIVSIEKVDVEKEKIKYVFDLEIADNHNYFAKNILVHNCSATYVLQVVKGKHFWNANRYEFTVCSRNMRLWEDDGSCYWRVVKKYNIEQVLYNLIGDNEWIAIQGECIAPKVQGNVYHVTEPDLYVFNVIYPTGRLGSLEAKELVEKQGMKFVPIISEEMQLQGKTVNEVLDIATGKSQLYDTLREGIVFRSLDGVHSFKAVSPEYLIKKG